MPLANIVAFEKLKAAVGHWTVSVFVKCGPCYPEQDEEHERLVISALRRRGADEKLKDVFTDHSFLYVPKIDSVCDEVSLQQVVTIGIASSV